MSESHRRLLDLGPSADTPAAGSGLPRELRKLKAWLGELPWANPDVALEELQQALVDLASRDDVSGPDRWAAVEALRGPVLEVIAIVSGRFLGVPLPLPAAGVAAARQVEALHRHLADACRRAAGGMCSSSGGLPMLRSGRVVSALERASHHYSQALSVAWSTYRTPEDGAWMGLYRTHHFAESVSVANKVPAQPSSDHAHTVRAHLVRTLLVALANPYAFDQDDQALLWRLSAGYAPLCSLAPVAVSPGDDEPWVAPVPVDADRGPGGLVDDPAQWMHLSFAAYQDDVADAIDQYDGDPASVVGIGRGRTLHQVPMSMLKQLRRAFGQRSARRHERLDGGHELEVVIGLAGLHFHLAGRDFDEFVRQAREHVIQVSDRAGWAQSGADAARAPLVLTQVLDQSLGGYRLGVREEGLVRARVGELVGLSWRQGPALAGLPRDWLVGVVRWLRYEDGGGVIVGVELLSRRAGPVALQSPGTRDEVHSAVRAVELINIEGEVHERGRFVVSLVDRPGGAVERLSLSYADTVDGEGDAMALTTISRAGEYLILDEVAGR